MPVVDGWAFLARGLASRQPRLGSRRGAQRRSARAPDRLHKNVVSCDVEVKASGEGGHGRTQNTNGRGAARGCRDRPAGVRRALRPPRRAPIPVGPPSGPRAFRCARSRERALRPRVGLAQAVPRSGRRDRLPLALRDRPQPPCLVSPQRLHRREGEDKAPPADRRGDRRERSGRRADRCGGPPAGARTCARRASRQPARRSANADRGLPRLPGDRSSAQLSCTETTARKWVSLGLRFLRTQMEVAR